MPRRIAETFGIVTVVVAASTSFAIQEAAAERWVRVHAENWISEIWFDADSVRRDASGMIHVRTISRPLDPAERIINCRDRTIIDKPHLDRGRPFERVNPEDPTGRLIARLCN